MTSRSGGLKILLPVVALLAMAASYATFLLPRETVYRLGREDGLFEDLTAVFFFGASALFAVAFWRSRRVDNESGGGGNDLFLFRTKRNWFFLLLAMLFFFGGGEEISWGQRIFGWSTPQTFEQANIQRETNIHNLKLFNRNDENWQGKSGLEEFLSAERLFSLFWLGFCVATPLAYWLVLPIARLLRRLNMPIVPLAIGLLFLANYATAETLKPRNASPDDVEKVVWPLMEIKECMFGMLFLLIAVYFVARHKPAAQPVAAPAAKPALAGPLHDHDEELAHT